MIALSVAALVAVASATTYFDENFSGEWESRWIQSKKKDDYGKWDVTAGKFYADAEASKGLHTSEDAHFYSISAKMDTPADMTQIDSKLFVQFEVKHEQNIDCGGGYIKLLPTNTSLTDFHGESPYYVMFGPDICGPGKVTHLILNHNGKNHLWQKEAHPKVDEFSHLYTLSIDFKHQLYEVKVDGESVEKGNLEDDWGIVEPKEINDPTDKKPEDWVDDQTIEDPEEKKPEGWDDIPATIVDAEAKKPDDWDTDEDGEWEAPMIANPDYKGVWVPKRIPNPEYKGPWSPKRIPNPDYKEEKEIAKFTDIGVVGFDLWQVRAGTIFDNILITDSDDVIDAALVEFKKKKELEVAAKDAQEPESNAPAAEEAAEAEGEAPEDEDDDEL